MAEFKRISDGIVANIEQVIIGKTEPIKLVLAAVLARGHVLLEDVPGTAKTMLARSLAVSLGCTFRRVQCTPDLLPTDVTGVSIFNQKSREFEFMPGPVFTNVLLADEINRATPRTQSALLEAMEERQVSVDGRTRPLAAPFIVLATQNPVEQEGTFPLPEAQLDRFLVRLSLGYPDLAQEREMLDRLHGGHPLERLKPVVNAKTIEQMQEVARKVFVHDQIKHYLLQIVHATRASLKLGLGGSPRASIALYRTSQALAAINGRNYVLPDDIKQLAVPVLAHRLILKPEYRLRRETAASVVEEVLERVEIPAQSRAMKAKKSKEQIAEGPPAAETSATPPPMPLESSSRSVMPPEEPEPEKELHTLPPRGAGRPDYQAGKTEEFEHRYEIEGFDVDEDAEPDAEEETEGRTPGIGEGGPGQMPLGGAREEDPGEDPTIDPFQIDEERSDWGRKNQ